MTIPSLSTGLVGSASQQQGVSNANAKLAAVLASLAGGTTQTTDSVADVALASVLQSQTGGLQEAAASLAQASSLTQVAGGGVGQIQDIVGQLQSLAEQAQSPTLNADNRKQLNQQFQQLAQESDAIAGSTSFNGRNLLDGSLSGANALSLDNLLGQSSSSSDNTLSIPSLSTSSLFGQNLDILSAGDAAQAATVLGNVQNQLTGTLANVGAFQQSLNFTAANVDSATTNLQAATSQLSDTDFAQASTEDSSATIQQNFAIALEAQGNHLNPALLQLVG